VPVLAPRDNGLTQVSAFTDGALSLWSRGLEFGGFS
jgi:hypothetical protein